MDDAEMQEMARFLPGCQEAVHEWDGDAAESGAIDDSESTWMQTSVEGEGTLTFWWKVSSESGCDELEFYLDNTLQHAISGEADWAQKSYNITGSGTHTLKWRYYKDGSVDEGDDRGWVDYVQWSGYVASDPTLVPTVWETITYTYDPAGRRVAKAYDGTTVVKYLYDGDHCLAEYDGSDQLLRKYVYGPGVDQPVCLIETAESNAAYYYHFDGLGSVVALSDAAGSTVQLYEYSVYGQVAASDPNHPNRFMFTAREFDADTGLYYYRARYYNPYIGRFLQTDRARNGMNAYTYCHNNPAGFTDPSGCVAIWRERDDGTMYRLLRIPPAVYASGTPRIPFMAWKVPQFFWWYVWHFGATLDLADTGLMGKIKNADTIRACVNTFRGKARPKAVEEWNRINGEQTKWLARAKAYREGKISADELGDRPPSESEFVLDFKDEPYNFTAAQYALDLIVLGHGWLKSYISLTVRWKQDLTGEGQHGGDIAIYYTFKIDDWFRDVLDPLNKIPDTHGYFLEFDNGWPYRMRGLWSEHDYGTLSPGDGAWSWEEMMF